jgi:hypothetical protein
MQVPLQSRLPVGQVGDASGGATETSGVALGFGVGGRSHVGATCGRPTGTFRPPNLAGRRGCCPVRGALPPGGRPQVAPTWDVSRAKGVYSESQDAAPARIVFRQHAFDRLLNQAGKTLLATASSEVEQTRSLCVGDFYGRPHVPKMPCMHVHGNSVASSFRIVTITVCRQRIRSDAALPCVTAYEHAPSSDSRILFFPAKT